MLKATSSPTESVAADHQSRAEIEDARGDDLVHELHELACGVAEAQHAEAGRDVAGELFFPAALHLRLDRHGFQRLDAGHALDQEGLVLRAAAEFFVEPAAEQRRHACRDRDVERERGEHDEGQLAGIDEHHREKDRGEEADRSPASAPSSSGNCGCSPVRGPAPRNRRRGAPGNRTSAAPADGGTAVRRARRRCGWSCARTGRCAGCRARSRTARSRRGRSPARRAS